MLELVGRLGRARGADRGGFAKASAKLSRKLAGRRVSRCGGAVDVCSALAAPQARSDRRSRILTKVNRRLLAKAAAKAVQESRRRP